MVSLTLDGNLEASRVRVTYPWLIRGDTVRLRAACAATLTRGW